MKDYDRITIDPAVMNGQPCIRGTRLTLRRVLLALAQYPDHDALRKDFPQLQEEDIHQALEYAAANLDDEIVEFRTAP